MTGPEPGGDGIDGHELAQGGVLGDDGVGLRGGDVHHEGQRMEPGLQGARAQRVPRQRLLHALAVLAAAPKLVQVGVLWVTQSRAMKRPGRSVHSSFTDPAQAMEMSPEPRLSICTVTTFPSSAYPRTRSLICSWSVCMHARRSAWLQADLHFEGLCGECFGEL